MTNPNELMESHAQFDAAWSLYASCCPGGEVLHSDGLCIANARHPWSLMNAALLTAPLSSPADLAARAGAAVSYFRQENRPWFFTASQQYLGDGAEETLRGVGLGKSGSVVGMVAEDILAPGRPLPDVETRCIEDEAGRLALADLNASAYSVSPDWVRMVTSSETLWEAPLYGYNAWIDGQPVATTLVLPQNGTLYVAWVATATDHRRRGLADLVMRRALAHATEETGITRTVLHATADGYPVYLKMGYRVVDVFDLYGPV